MKKLREDRWQKKTLRHHNIEDASEKAATNWMEGIRENMRDGAIDEDD